MDHAERWAKRARKHVRTLSKGIGPRGATSEGERQAAEYVRDELQQLGLRDVRLESFRGSVSIWLPWSIAFSIATWGTFIGLLFGLVGGIVAAALHLVAAWIVYRELYPAADLASRSPAGSRGSKLRRQPLSGDRLVPPPHPDSRITQEPTQPSNCAQELGSSRYFASNPAHSDRTTLVDPNQQPDKVSNLGDPLVRSQFSNSLKPSMILLVDRHGSPPDEVFCGKSTLTGVCLPINYSFVKVSGS